MTLLDIAGLAIEIPTATALLRPVRGVDLAVASGETLALVGESGCGKSLTALAIIGLLPRHARLSAERIELGGRSLHNLSHRAWRGLRGSRVAMIFQDPVTALDPCYRVIDQMTEVLRQHRPVSAKAATARAVELLGKVGIASPAERARAYPHLLSGGLRQRVMIAMALLCEPDLIIADEPTTALDVTIQAQILRLLADLQRETGVGLLLITHDLGVVASVADRIAVMYGGQIVETGPAHRTLAQPLHPYTEGLIRAIPIPGASPRHAPLGFIPGTVPLQTGDLDCCGFLERCPYAHERCAAGPVPLSPTPDCRLARCVLPMDGTGREPAIWTRYL